MFSPPFCVRILLVLGLPISASCGGIDPLYETRNRRGDYVVDSEVGARSRMICVNIASSRLDCSTTDAPVLVRGISSPAQLQARWRDDRTIEIFLFGGEVSRCTPIVGEGEFNIELRQLPDASGRGVVWSDDDYRKFDAVRDSCGSDSAT